MTDSRAEDRQPSTDRTEAFSDGVFAIAITLLVLTIEVPSPKSAGTDHSLIRELLHRWPSYLAYLAAFLTIGITWLNHHGAFAKIVAVDPALQWWNLLLLLAVGIAPFPTELAANYLSASLTDAAARTAVITFVLVSGLRPLIWVGVWMHLRRHPELLDRSVTRTHAGLEVRRALIGVVLSGISAGVAVVVPVLGLGVYLTSSVFYAATSRGQHDA